MVDFHDIFFSWSFYLLIYLDMQFFVCYFGFVIQMHVLTNMEFDIYIQNLVPDGLSDPALYTWWLLFGKMISEWNTP